MSNKSIQLTLKGALFAHTLTFTITCLVIFLSLKFSGWFSSAQEFSNLRDKLNKTVQNLSSKQELSTLQKQLNQNFEKQIISFFTKHKYQKKIRKIPKNLPQNFLKDLSKVISIKRKGHTPALLLIKGVNLQIVNGEGDTATQNGLGNLVIGYNKSSKKPAKNRKGSHNLIIGDHHEYSSYGGVATGHENKILAPHVNILGGSQNIAFKKFSSIVGGRENHTKGELSSIIGGFKNRTFGHTTSVLGGQENKAKGSYSCILAGLSNNTEGNFASIFGGTANKTIDDNVSVFGNQRIKKLHKKLQSQAKSLEKKLFKIGTITQSNLLIKLTESIIKFRQKVFKKTENLKKEIKNDVLAYRKKVDNALSLSLVLKTRNKKIREALVKARDRLTKIKNENAKLELLHGKIMTSFRETSKTQKATRNTLQKMKRNVQMSMKKTLHIINLAATKAKLHAQEAESQKKVARQMKVQSQTILANVKLAVLRIQGLLKKVNVAPEKAQKKN